VKRWDRRPGYPPDEALASPDSRSPPRRACSSYTARRTTITIMVYPRQVGRTDRRDTDPGPPEPQRRLGPGARCRFREAPQGRQASVLDDYGATGPAEFFAVATECLLEKLAQMKRKHEELKENYRQDPAEQGAGPADGHQAPDGR
jgi:hypothetical protein